MKAKVTSLSLQEASGVSPSNMITAPLLSSSSSTAAEEQPTKKPKGEGSAPPPNMARSQRRRVKPPSPPALSPESIPLSTSLLTAPLEKEIKDVWAAARHADSTTTATIASDVTSVIPPFKVGTLEMYRRFPQAYDLLMQHHNCDAVQSTLLHDIMGRVEQTASFAVSADVPKQGEITPWMRVADFGCGTGRIETMVVQHRAVQAIYAYDGEAAMLKQCLLNTVRSAAQSKHYQGVSLCPAATTTAASTASSSLHCSTACIELCMDDDDRGAGTGSDGRTQKAAWSNTGLPTLQLCVRPVPFQAVQDGFLTATHHPRCSLMVCAWSLSYVMRMQWGEERWHAAVDAVVQGMIDHLDTSTSDAAVVILETLGNGSAEPTRQNTYTQRLEDHFGFERTWVRTDYEFATRAAAERMVRFFFGEKMLAKLTMDDDGGERCRLMECTGIWTLWKTRQHKSE